jgi:Tol biopolymer transport system component
MSTNWKIVLGSCVVILVGVLSIGFFISRSSPNSPTQTIGSFFGVGGNVSTGQTGSDGTNTPQTGNRNFEKIFKIADGPVAGAAFTQTSAPTTTLVRFVMANNGHILDQAIDVPGAAARAASNTTIPGVISAVWGKNATSTILQYMDSGTLKSVSVVFASSSTAGSVSPVRIQFLPSNITSLALSPDSKNVVYLLTSASGVDGYVADVNGANAKKLFSLPLSQVLVSWPSQNTILAQTKSAAGVPGVVFSINVKTGVATPMLYASGLSATANSTFSKVVYQIVANVAGTHDTYSHDTTSGQDIALPFNPFAEKCTWSPLSQTLLYCAAPLTYVDGSYLDLWHQGLASVPDSIFTYDLYVGSTQLVITPGSGNAAPQSMIDQLAVSPDGKYLLFITRGDRSLWGVRL